MSPDDGTSSNLPQLGFIAATDDDDSGAVGVVHEASTALKEVAHAATATADELNTSFIEHKLNSDKRLVLKLFEKNVKV